MKYRIIAIGSLKRGFLQEGCTFYHKRLSHLAPCELVELKETRGTPYEVRQRESEGLLKVAKGYTAALDERGKPFTSEGLAKRIEGLELTTSTLTLLIGGAEGHSDTLRTHVNELWSLSNLTLPHELARLLLLEQLYRAESIRSGHPYHRP